MTVLPHSALWTSSLTCTWWHTWWAPTSTTSSRPSDFQTIMFSFWFIRLSEAWNMFTRLGSFTGKYYFLLFDDFWRLWCIVIILMLFIFAIFCFVDGKSEQKRNMTLFTDDEIHLFWFYHKEKYFGCLELNNLFQNSLLSQTDKLIYTKKDQN